MKQPHPIIPNTETGRITKRLVVTLIGSALIYLFLQEHRNWVWAYFESVVTLDSPDAEQIAAAQAIASASISSLTTVSISASATIAALVIWFVTGNVMALRSMFKWTSSAQVVGSAAAQAISDVKQSVSRSEEIQKITQTYAERHKDDPSYAPIKPDTEEAFR